MGETPKTALLHLLQVGGSRYNGGNLRARRAALGTRPTQWLPLKKGEPLVTPLFKGGRGDNPGVGLKTILLKHPLIFGEEQNKIINKKSSLNIFSIS